MSYDIKLAAPGIEDVEGYPVTLEGYYMCPTYNLAPMFREALGCSIRDLSGRTCRDAAPLILEAIEKMKADPARFEALNPPNGWGDAAGARETLVELSQWCATVPDAVILI